MEELNKNIVKNALRSAPDYLEMVRKFLNPISGNLVTITDLSYWWDSNDQPWNNRPAAIFLLNILRKEECVRLSRCVNRYAYKKTEQFVELLQEILRMEELLEKNGD